MLTVRVDAPAERVPVILRPCVAGCDPGPEAAVLSERDRLGAVLSGDLDRPVGRAVVDDEHVDTAELAAQVVEDRGQVVLLVPRGDEDERVAQCVSSSSAARSCALRTDSAASSQASACGVGATRATWKRVAMPKR